MRRLRRPLLVLVLLAAVAASVFVPRSLRRAAPNEAPRPVPESVVATVAARTLAMPSARARMVARDGAGREVARAEGVVALDGTRGTLALRVATAAGTVVGASRHGPSGPEVRVGDGPWVDATAFGQDLALGPPAGVVRLLQGRVGPVRWEGRHVVLEADPGSTAPADAPPPGVIPVKVALWPDGDGRVGRLDVGPLAGGAMPTLELDRYGADPGP